MILPGRLWVRVDLKPAIDIIGKERCAGCFGCYNSCPEDAITMKLDDDGFYMPEIDREKCTECGICEKHCPVITVKNVNSPKPKFHAARTNDAELLMKSSSGGIFGEIARYVLGKGGVVYGAGWNEKLELVHKRIDGVSKLPSIMGSKYIQSDIGRTYTEIIALAREGRMVLFCGTPCQVAALNLFMDDKTRQNVLECDLICHGVASTSVLNYYLKGFKREVKDISFRSKKNGWADFSMEIRFLDGNYLKSHKTDMFMKGFLKNIYLRKACYDCPFASMPRHGDVTLGDLWGAEKEYYDHNGVSIILENSPDGGKVIEQLVKAGKIKVKDYPGEKAIQNNPRIARGKLEIPKQRKDFLRDARTKTFDEVFKIYIDNQNIIKSIKMKLSYKKFKKIQKQRKKDWHGFD